jgi:hypothetical protein
MSRRGVERRGRGFDTLSTTRILRAWIVVPERARETRDRGCAEDELGPRA